MARHWCEDEDRQLGVKAHPRRGATPSDLSAVWSHSGPLFVQGGGAGRPVEAGKLALAGGMRVGSVFPERLQTRGDQDLSWGGHPQPAEKEEGFSIWAASIR